MKKAAKSATAAISQEVAAFLFTKLFQNIS